MYYEDGTEAFENWELNEEEKTFNDSIFNIHIFYDSEYSYFTVKIY